MFRKPLLLSILLFISGVTAAQTRLWTFRQCLDTALVRNITVNQTRYSNELNKVQLAQTRAGRIPSLNASAGEALNLGKNIDPTTNSFVTEAYHSTNLGITSGLTLFNGLQTTNTIRQQRLNVEAGEYETEKVKNDITLNITTGYLQVLFAKEVLASAKIQEEATAAQEGRTEKWVNAGKLPESDLLQIRSQLASDRLAVINAENQLELAKVTLMQLMEIPVTDDFDVEIPALDILVSEIPLSNEQIFEKSLTVQPQITGASLRSGASEMALRVSEGARWPRVNLGANLNTNFASGRKKNAVNSGSYPFFEQIWDNVGQSFSMGLTIPIYSNRQIRSNIERAKINLATTRLNESNVRNTLRKNVEQTWADVRAAGKKYDAVQQQVIAMEATYRNAETKYQVGVMHATDFLIQKNNYEQAKSSLIQAKFDYIFKQKILGFYQGNTIEF